MVVWGGGVDMFSGLAIAELPARVTLLSFACPKESSKEKGTLRTCGSAGAREAGAACYVEFRSPLINSALVF